MNDQDTPPAGQTQVTRGRLLAGIVLAAAVAVLLIFRLHAFDVPLETDECNYAYIGNRLLQGDRLYVDVWDHQPPGVFVLVAGTIALLGQSDYVFRWLATGFSIASLVIVFDLTRRHYGRLAATFAALLFAVTSADPGTAGEGCNREVYMNLFALAALWLATGERRSSNVAWPRSSGLGPNNRVPTSQGGGPPYQLFLAGLLLGVGSAFKMVVAAQWLLLAIWLALRIAIRRGGMRNVIAALGWLGLGPALVWAGIFAYFAATGRWSAFTEAVFGFNVGYASISESFFTRYADFATWNPWVFKSAMPLWIASLVALPILLFLSGRRLLSTDGAVVAYALGSFQAVCLPGLYWPHYYHLLMPAMILLCAAALTRSVERLASPPRTVVLLLGVGIVVAVATLQLQRYLLLDPLQATERRYAFRQQWAHDQGRRVADLTDPQDTIFVWGRDAGIYYYSGRRCASRYTMVGALDEKAEGHERHREILLEELRATRPRLVLLVEPEFEGLARFLQEHYVLAGMDMHDRRPNEPIMLVLMDKDRRVPLVDWEWRRPTFED